ncbi:Starch-binding associating with outer membrane [Belliella buryatensis]|uniref:Starch-binding associating with outer membrane n=1 Tax=Belliella buryatensis TaxID=1500549 RepID=A0A239ETG8_9BACT|nr:RagB/SusD family nutrient uptake outer membrane protein [Belliella buryatensis]SNS47966.1 Starch-binding associating with outer membrane [Belliella buryatensis]
MKKYIKILFLAVSVMAASACADFLEPTPFSFTAPENFYRTANDAEIALVGVYSTLTAGSVQGAGNASGFRRDLMEMLAKGTDEGVKPANFANLRGGQFGTAGFTSSDFEINNAWFFLYAGIGRANSLLENLENMPDNLFAGSRKIEIEAEAKVLRGFQHMMLSMMFGAIPIYTSTSDDPNLPRLPVQEVYEQIISDLEFGYENLQHRGPRAATVNKWTAAGLLVKIYAYLASMNSHGLSDFGYTPNSFAWVDVAASYNNALTISADLIANSGYILTENYDRLFRETTKSAQAQEVMLSAEGSTDPSQNVITIVVNNFIPQGNSPIIGAGSGWTRPTGELYNLYNVNDFRFSHNVSGNLGGNPNILDVLVVDGVRYFQPRPLPGPNSPLMSVGKYRLMDPAQKSYAAFATALSFPLLRLGDILLLRAEALYFTGDEAGARVLLSQVRERSVLPSSSVAVLNNAYFREDFFEELIDERSRELCFEIWRRIDLARFNKYDEKINALNPNFGAYNSNVNLIKQNWRSERVWFPIPIQQIDLNPNLDQNPGY